MTRDERWVVATTNAGKVHEISAILGDCGVSLDALPRPDAVKFPDEGIDYERNALEKARAAASQLGVTAVADDSGLEVKGLDWAPGPLSARFGGPGLSDAQRVEHLLEQLSRFDEADRAARFVCYAAIAAPDGTEHCVRGDCLGWISRAPIGEGGFGYDPIFLVESRELTMAQLDEREKNRISHRARAFTMLWRWWCDRR